MRSSLFSMLLHNCLDAGCQTFINDCLPAPPMIMECTPPSQKVMWTHVRLRIWPIAAAHFRPQGRKGRNCSHGNSVSHSRLEGQESAVAHVRKDEHAWRRQSPSPNPLRKPLGDKWVPNTVRTSNTGNRQWIPPTLDIGEIREFWDGTSFLHSFFWLA